MLFAHFMLFCAVALRFFPFFFVVLNFYLTFASKIVYESLNFTVMSEIESRVKAIIIEKFGVSESMVTSEANFTNDLSADSLDRVELIMEIEDEFGISIPEDAAEKIATVGDAVKFVEEMVAEK